VPKNGVYTLAFIADVEVISCIILGMRRLQPAWVVRCRTTWVGPGGFSFELERAPEAVAAKQGTRGLGVWFGSLRPSPRHPFRQTSGVWGQAPMS